MVMPRDNVGSTVRIRAPGENRTPPASHTDSALPAFYQDYSLKINASYTDPTTLLTYKSPPTYFNGRTVFPKIDPPKPPVPQFVSNWGQRRIAIGERSTIVLKHSGQLAGWGWMAYREMDKTPAAYGSSPTRYSTLNLPGCIQVVAGFGIFGFLLDNGKVMTSGDNRAGILGRPGNAVENPPELLAGISDVVDIQAGLDCIYMLRANGDLYMLGRSAINFPSIPRGTILATPTRITSTKIAWISSDAQKLSGNNRETFVCQTTSGDVNVTISGETFPKYMAGLAGKPIDYVDTGNNDWCRLVHTTDGEWYWCEESNAVKKGPAPWGRAGVGPWVDVGLNKYSSYWENMESFAYYNNKAWPEYRCFALKDGGFYIHKAVGNTFGPGKLNTGLGTGLIHYTGWGYPWTPINVVLAQNDRIYTCMGAHEHDQRFTCNTNTESETLAPINTAIY